MGSAEGGAEEAPRAEGGAAAEGVPAGTPAAAAEADWERQVAERDERIGALEAQVAEAARSAEKAEELARQIAELRAAAEEERVDFALQLAGARSVKAARAVLGDYGGDVAKMRAAEPWLFAGGAPRGGATGLPSAGAAADEAGALARWREIAGLAGGTDE
jgi:hypothetical protein